MFGRRQIPEHNDAFAWGVCREIRFDWCHVVCCTTVHHPTHGCSRCIEGNTDFIIDLLNGGPGRCCYMTIYGGFTPATTRCVSLFLLLRLFVVLLLLVAVGLDVPLLIAIVANETGVVPFLAASFNGGGPNCVK